jgi:hypothetical protein
LEFAPTLSSVRKESRSEERRTSPTRPKSPTADTHIVHLK